MLPVAPVLSSTTLIRELVGPLSLDRGAAYASQGRVLDVSWVAPMSIVRASVLGSGGMVYRTAVHSQVRHGFLMPQHGICTCPVGANCKHAAAALLAYMWDETNFEEPDPRAPWERMLDSLIGDGGAQPMATEERTLGVQFELRPRTLQRYQAAAMQKIKNGDIPHTSKLELVLRPVQLNDKGRWVSGNLAWQHFRYTRTGGVPVLPFDYTYDPDQVEWFCTLLQLNSFAAWNGTHLSASDFLSPMVWNHLERATALGIELRGPSAKSSVKVHEPVTIRTDVASEGRKLRIRPALDVLPAEFDTDFIGTVSDHGVFWWNASDGMKHLDLRLAPTRAKIPPLITGLLATDKKVVVPANGRESFEREYLPKLAKATELSSLDCSVEVPASLAPKMLLRVKHILVKPDTARRRKDEKAGVPGVELQWGFAYGEIRVPLDNAPVPGVDRDPKAELALQREAGAAMADFPGALGNIQQQERTTDSTIVISGVEAARFTAALPTLQAIENLEVTIEGETIGFEELTADPLITISAENTETNDWFDLGVEVRIDGNNVPFTELFQALAHGDEYLMLPDGKYFALDRPEYEQLRRLIEEARALSDSTTDGTIRISKHQASLWEDLKDIATNVEASEAWKASSEGLSNILEVAHAPLPAGIDATLRPYQREGFEWLSFLYDNGLGGVLADDMGLGKTLQTLALIQHAKDNHDETAGKMPPFLVVAPTSVVSNWEAEAKRFAPDLRSVYITETVRRGGIPAHEIAAEVDIVITSYGLFRIDQEEYAATKFSGLILDEAQFVKNPATQASKQARDFPTSFKLAITGTPMENNLSELWSMFAIAAPGLFPTLKRFDETYRKPIEKDGDNEALKRLRRRIRPLMLRRTKELVATDLPEKQEQVLELELNPKHRTIYQRHLQRERQKVLGMLEDMDKNRFAVFSSLTKLRQLSLDASLIDDEYASVPSSKLDALLEQLEDLTAEGHNALVFSQFTSFLSKASDRLTEAGIEHAYLDGSTTKRAKVIESFTSGKVQVFLISLKAGGFGLNLTQADYCFLMDPWWNPASENQAVDRAHRIGQKRNVMVYRMVSKNTIEEKVMALKDKKAKLFTAVLDDDAAFASAISADDVRSLFAD
ncbi:DEAD/DEAH box helicase [Paeniglutamicibacter sulfureus]|uniref:Superfamily II DNA or RNA helicase n=1 Tax=Paeniglutamicibacter sulfureus TaxID=43666 RepID=A0ABU2BHB5_9MICC|nr:DEAD/DEAH box helicase [Paeniglutamicibacter sulfureus]MDO2933622.1 DEAD/DEAH box helicase [Paeniglutamicibacter sulfureus]MDR7358043.1 superfamily II DNA or RNA helicase [Paeniglutamicibacter sulfureus]